MSAGTSNPLAGAIVEPPSLKPGSLASFSFSNMEELKAGKEPLPASPRSSLSKNIHKLSLVDAASKIGGNNSGLARSSLGSKPVSPSGYQLSRLSEERLDDKERYKRSNGADERGPSGMRNSRSPIYRPKSELLQTSRDWSPAQSPKSRNNKFQLPNKSSESSNNNNNNNNVTRKQRSNSTNRWSALEDAADLVGAEEDADEGSLSMMLTLARTRSVDHQSGGRNVFAAGGRANLKHTNNTNHINTTNTNNNSNSTNHINGTRTTPIRNKPRAETLGWRSPGAATRREEALVASPKGVRDTRRIKNVLSTDALPQLAKMAMMRSAIEGYEAAEDGDNSRPVRRVQSTVGATTGSPTLASRGNIELFKETQLERSQSSSYSDIQAQVPCWNWKFGEGQCQFGKHCHYMHAYKDGTVETDHATIAGTTPAGEMRRKNSFASKGNVESKEMLSQMAPIDTSQIDCKFFNFARGKCTFGKQCFYRHANLDGTLYEETSGGSLELLLRFNDPYGFGDICAAGVIPYAHFQTKMLPTKETQSEAPGAGPPAGYSGFGCEELAEGEPGDAVWALLQVEDMFKPQENAWVPSLAMFGGKVALNDEDWRHTAAREFQEEVGYILGDKESGVPKKMSEFSRTEVDVAKAYTSYLAISKYQLLEYPIEPEDIDAFLQLPKEYWNKYKGEVAKDWSRAATRIEPVVLKREEHEWKVKNIWTGEDHELPKKVILQAALKNALFPISDERAVQLAKERDQRKTLEQKEQDEIQKLGVMENTANDMAADILSGLDFLEGEQKAASAAADADGWNVVPARRGSTRKNRNNSESENTHQRVHRSNSNAIRKESMPKGRQRSTSAAGRNMNQARGSTGQKGSTPSALRR